MVRMVVLYEREVDPDRYQRHLDEFVANVEYAAFRHGKAFGSPFDAPAFGYYAEFEWDDMESFQATARSEAFAASGKDAMEMGIPFTATFVELAE
jgi:hypothetical protein